MRNQLATPEQPCASAGASDVVAPSLRHPVTSASDSVTPSLRHSVTPLSATPFFELQLAFNLYPAAYAHPSWLMELQSSCGSAQSGNWAGNSPFRMRTLSTALLRHWRLDRQFDFDFFDSAKRLALLEAAELTRIAGLAGAVLMRDRIRRCVDRTAVTALQGIIGADAHRFALRWEQDASELADLAGQWSRSRSASWSDAAEWAAHSTELISAAIALTSPGVLGRLQFRFPRAWSGDPGRRLRLTENQRTSLARLLIDIIVAERSEWSWLFIAQQAQQAPHATRPAMGRQS